MLRFSLALFSLMLPAAIWAQSGISCQTTPVTPIVRSEGVAERLGDIVLTCTGMPGTTVTGNLAVFLNTTVTNRDLGSGAIDVIMTIDDAPVSVPARLDGTNRVTWSGLTITIPAARQTSIRISNLRGDASIGGEPQVPPPFGGSGVGFPQQIVAQLAFNPGGLFNFTVTNFPVAVAERGLQATTITRVVPSQSGSELPADTSSFLAFRGKGTAFASTRVTEAHATAFEPRSAQSTQGTRIMVRFSGYPADARLFVPATVAGSNAAVPTAAGDFGGTASGGQYVPGSSTLLLSRVLFTDPQGGGGTALPVQTVGGSFDAITEVTLQNGEGTAVFEVIDGNPQVRESAQIPVFIGLARSPSARSITAQVQATFAPISTSATISTIAPVPRFRNVAAGPDCGFFQDCESYIPKLEAEPANTDFRLTRGVGAQERTLFIRNEGGGLMPFSVTVEYNRGRGWIFLTPTQGDRPVAIRMVVTALPEMEPGQYTATVIIDAGAAGVARYPIRLEVVASNTSPPPPLAPRPAITSLLHGATFQPGPVARGSLVTLRGTNLGGQDVSVTFDGRPARLLFAGSDQINLQVPADLASNTSQVVVTVGGIASEAFTTNVAAANPGIFNPGIVNQDGSVNSSTNPADTGSSVQIFATGLLAADGSGVVDAKVHDLTYTALAYAGPAPGIPGVQQVNVRIEESWPTMQTEVVLCTTAGGSRQCSTPARIYLRGR